MRTNILGINLIKESEGCKLEAYADPATGSHPYTIGYGHTGKEVVPGYKITQAVAEALLIQDIENIEKQLFTVPLRKLTDNQFSAIVSFIYNVGFTNFKSSTLYKDYLKDENVSILFGAMEFIRWSKAAGKPMPGLVKRRAKETYLFVS